MSVEECSTSFTSNSSIEESNQSPKCSPKAPSKRMPTKIVLTPEIKYSLIIEKILRQNKKSPDYLKKVQNNKDGHFTCKIVPGISILDYLSRIIKYTKIESSTLVISMIYFLKICQKNIFISEYNVHRIMLISIYIAYKYNEDCIFKNKHLALVSGISIQEMTLLEAEFLEIMNFELFVDDKTFKQYNNFFKVEE